MYQMLLICSWNQSKVFVTCLVPSIRKRFCELLDMLEPLEACYHATVHLVVLYQPENTTAAWNWLFSQRKESIRVQTLRSTSGLSKSWQQDFTPDLVLQTKEGKASCCSSHYQDQAHVLDSQGVWFALVTHRWFSLGCPLRSSIPTPLITDFCCRFPGCFAVIQPP